MTRRVRADAAGSRGANSSTGTTTAAPAASKEGSQEASRGAAALLVSADWETGGRTGWMQWNVYNLNACVECSQRRSATVFIFIFDPIVTALRVFFLSPLSATQPPPPPAVPRFYCLLPPARPPT